jgi:transposase
MACWGMKAYSPDLRTRIVDAVEAGTSKAEAARTFDVGLSTVKRYVRRKKTTGSLDPRRSPGRTPTIGPQQQEILRAQLRAHPAAYLDEHCALWETNQGVRVSTSTMGRAIRKVGFTRKKGHWVPVSAMRPSDAAGTVSSLSVPSSASSSSMNRVRT